MNGKTFQTDKLKLTISHVRLSNLHFCLLFRYICRILQLHFGFRHFYSASNTYVYLEIRAAWQLFIGLNMCLCEEIILTFFQMLPETSALKTSPPSERNIAFDSKCKIMHRETCLLKYFQTPNSLFRKSQEAPTSCEDRQRPQDPEGLPGGCRVKCEEGGWDNSSTVTHLWLLQEY